MSDLITLVSENEAFLSSVPVYIISLRRKKSTYAILDAISILSLSRLTHLFSIIFSRILFVISKCMALYFGKNLFLLLIIGVMWGVLKALRLKWWLM